MNVIGEIDGAISIGKNKEYKKEKIFYMDVLKTRKQSKNEVKRKR